MTRSIQLVKRGFGDLEALLSDRELSPRDKILALQAELALLPSIEPFVTVKHHFAPGQYAREFSLVARPWGDERQSLCIGKIHKHAHVNVVSKGRCTVYTEQGLMEIEAPFTFVSEPGAKRVVLIHEDLVWTTVHANPTNTRDLAVIEHEVIAPTYDNLLEGA
jgi:hypothetical protein